MIDLLCVTLIHASHMLPTHGPDEIIPKCTLKPDCARMNPGSYIHRSHVNLGDPFAQIPHHGIDPSHLRMREDSACTRKLRSAGTLATMHAPHLYYHMAHGNNTFGSDHFALMAKQVAFLTHMLIRCQLNPNKAAFPDMHVRWRASLCGEERGS